ncbi:MAG: N-acetyl sugar amidotransferase [Proteobacteria bacterium]|nr:N-acetyl sugar amidotransferase [Pseudomonadota bacterium]
MLQHIDKKIIYCKKCLYPSNHPLNLSFNAKGICSGCVVHEEKDNYDWIKALGELKKIVASYQNQGSHDCIVPVCGARDSYYIVHFVKHVLNLNPLLVSYNRHYNTALGIQLLERLRTRLGCDIVTSTIAPSKLKLIIQQTLSLKGSIHWAYLAGSTVFPVQVAVKRKIPLIIWGAHQGIDQVGMFFHKDQVEMTRRYRKEHDLLGLEPEDLVNKTAELTEKLLSPLFYPSDKALNNIGVRGIYLNNFIYWDSKQQHEKMIALYGYQPYSLSRTFDSYNDIDCQYYMDVHDEIKYLKFGFSKIADQVAREIRLGRLTKIEGAKLIHYFQKQAIINRNKLMQWLEISLNDFYAYIEPFRDPLVWEKQNNQWFKKTNFDYEKYTDDEIKTLLRRLNFQSHQEKTTLLFNKSQLLMRGWAN